MNSRHRLLLLCVYLAAAPASAQTCNPESIPATTPTAQFTDPGDGTLTDTRTGLMWKRCAEGQTWSGTGCSGGARTYTWQEALQRAKAVNIGQAGENLGHRDWRLPNQKELKSIVEEQCYDPAINLALFPNTPSDYFWSSSPVASYGNYAWLVDFDGGYDGWGDKDGYAYAVRLVRGGQ